jgi:hypothetical protein
MGLVEVRLDKRKDADLKIQNSIDGCLDCKIWSLTDVRVWHVLTVRTWTQVERCMLKIRDAK